jgi:hypothetical protein
MEGPKAIDEEVGANELRVGLAQYLDRTKHASMVFLVRNQKRSMDMAVLVPPGLWEELGHLERAGDGLSSTPGPAGGYLSRRQLADYLQIQSEQIGEETYQLTAGEMRLVCGLLGELAGQHPGEPLSTLAREWADRLGTRIAPTS